MVQSPSWEANWFATSQEIPRILRNPKVHYHTHKHSPPVCVLGQPNPVHISTSHLLEIRPNIIHPSTPRSPHWSLSLRFTHQDPIHPPLLTHTRHMPKPSHSSRFYHPQKPGPLITLNSEGTTKFLTCQTMKKVEGFINIPWHNADKKLWPTTTKIIPKTSPNYWQTQIWPGRRSFPLGNGKTD